MLQEVNVLTSSSQKTVPNAGVKGVLMILVFLTLQLTALFSQTHTPLIKGRVVWNKPAFKHFAVIMQDTSIQSGNRFGKNKEFVYQDNFTYSQGNVYTEFKPLILNDSLFRIFERILLVNDEADSIKYDHSEKKGKHWSKKIKNRYIRLYAGYFDENGNICVTVQFVTPREYKKEEYIYSRQLFMIHGMKNLRFAEIKLRR